MPDKPKKIQLIFIIYWILLSYIIAALIFWFITLNQQNIVLSELRTESIQRGSASYPAQMKKIEDERQIKIKQYAGEGASFLLVILTGAIFVFRAVRKQLKINQEQQNFMMAITHELKTPIAVAKLNLETIQKRKLDEAQRERLLQNTLFETNRLNTLCNNMLLSSQIEAGGYRMVKEKMNLSELVKNCTREYENRYPQRTIDQQIENSVFINGDTLLLEMTINNLLDNAIKYSPREKPIMIQLSVKEAVAELQITDYGPGIADEEKKKVFKKFYRLGNEATKRAKGTGLGLFITKKIIDSHGGNIFILNNPTGGSIFTIQQAAIV